MADKVIMTIKPVVRGLDDYMSKVERLSSLLSESIRIYDELKDAEFVVDYEVVSPTLKS